MKIIRPVSRINKKNVLSVSKRASLSSTRHWQVLHLPNFDLEAMYSSRFISTSYICQQIDLKT